MEEKMDIKWVPLLEKLHDIPTLPMVANQVTNLINDPNSSSGDIASVLRKDQVLTAKVLKLINSPYYGIPGEVTDVQRALAFLGFNTIAQLVLSLSVFSLFPRDNKDSFSVLEFWRHALATAVVSEIIAKKVGYEKPEECFTCGLLHDIGKLVLKQVAPDEFQKVISLARSKSISYTSAEEQLGLPGHGYLGENIAERWRLPLVIRMCIRYHHVDVTELDTILETFKKPIQIVRFANQWVVNKSIGYSGDASGGALLDEHFEPLGIERASIDLIAEKMLEEIENAGSFLRSAA
jgi:putative nucleotidyltransferase with HDIG domain